jgi:hypothetical protein
MIETIQLFRRSVQQTELQLFRSNRLQLSKPGSGLHGVLNIKPLLVGVCAPVRADIQHPSRITAQRYPLDSRRQPRRRVLSIDSHAASAIVSRVAASYR